MEETETNLSTAITLLEKDMCTEEGCTQCENQKTLIESVRIAGYYADQVLLRQYADCSRILRDLVSELGCRGLIPDDLKHLAIAGMSIFDEIIPDYINDRGEFDRSK